MLDQIHNIPGKKLNHQDYHQDFARETNGLCGVLWKLERSQTFREPGDASWEALISGDWEHALGLLEKDREAVRAEARHNAAQGFEIRRVRVVEQPVSPYVQWELHALRMLAKEGFGVHVLLAQRLSSLESVGQLPEVVVIEGRVLYEIQYENDWTPCGARRIATPDVIQAAGSEIAMLYDLGEPLLSFFDREIAPLSAPSV
jgi:hypothetical protein